MITTINDLKNKEPKLLFDVGGFQLDKKLSLRNLKKRAGLAKWIKSTELFKYYLALFLDNKTIEGDISSLLTTLNNSLTRYKCKLCLPTEKFIEVYRVDKPYFKLDFQANKKRVDNYYSFDSSTYFTYFSKEGRTSFNKYYYPCLQFDYLPPEALSQYSIDWWHKRVQEERDNYPDTYEGNKELSNKLSFEWLEIVQEEPEKWIID